MQKSNFEQDIFEGSFYSKVVKAAMPEKGKFWAGSIEIVRLDPIVEKI